MAPNMPMIVGKDDIWGALSIMFSLPGIVTTWHPEEIEVARSGEIGIVRGRYENTFAGADGSPYLDRGKYIEVWHKQPDGSRRVALEIINSDLPPLNQ